MPDPTPAEIAAVIRFLGARLDASPRKRLCLSTRPKPPTRVMRGNLAQRSRQAVKRR
jgi:hypothetical protein